MKGMSITKCPQNILINVLRERPQNNIKAKTSVNFYSHFSSLDSQKKIRFFITLKIDKKKDQISTCCKFTDNIFWGTVFYSFWQELVKRKLHTNQTLSLHVHVYIFTISLNKRTSAPST